MEAAINTVTLAEAIYLNVKFEKPGNTSQLTKAEKEMALREAQREGVNTNLLRATKTLWESEAYTEICKFDKERSALLLRRTLPATTIFRAGFRLIPADTVEYWQQDLEAWREARNGLIDRFLRTYEQALEQARQQLGPLFNAAQYSSVNKMRRSFNLSWVFFQACLPEGMTEGGKAREILESLTRETLIECRIALRESFYALVKKAADRLKVQEDGTKNVFRDTLTTNMQEFLNVFDSQNSIVGDLALRDLVEKARAIFSLVPEAERLRTDLALRERVRETMQEVQDVMEREEMVAAGSVNLDLTE